MSIEYFDSVFNSNKDKEAIIWRDQKYSYNDLIAYMKSAKDVLIKNDVKPSSVVAIESDFSPYTIAMLLELIRLKCVIVPLTDSVKSKKEEFLQISEVEWRVQIENGQLSNIENTEIIAKHELILNLKEMSRPGLVLFSSGTTGKSKAAIHDFVPLLEKFLVKRNTKKMITFLLFDHIGGINTLFYILSNAGTLVVVEDRSPKGVLSTIEKFGVQVLPTSPTFLNLMLISGIYNEFNLSTLELVTYGTEPMPSSTLELLVEKFPNISFQQTYGLSELGILRSKSKSSDSLWVKVGGEGFETRVREGLLEIKAKSAMLGYLNAPSPFTEDGWFMTGDLVEVDGDYFKILGRKSDMINVGGEKVYPSEVEAVLLKMDGVSEAVVTGEKNAIVGNMVKATVRLSSDTESLGDFKKRMMAFFKTQGVQKFKIPQKIELSKETLYSERFKTLRNV